MEAERTVQRGAERVMRERRLWQLHAVVESASDHGELISSTSPLQS